MMTLDVRLGWVVKVDPVDLVAHLEVFVKLKPTLDTLRLCNVFGQGPNAHITKLPVELIERIGMCLVRPERRKARKYHEKRFECYTDDCAASDHYSQHQKALAYRYYNTDVFVHECKPEPDCLCSFSPADLASVKLNDRQALKLNDLLGWFDYKVEQVGEIGGVKFNAYHEIHRERKWEWLQKTGYPRQTARQGLISRHQALFRQITGLELVVSQRQIPATHRGFSPRVTTDAYLLLSSANESPQTWIKSHYDEVDDQSPDLLDERGPMVETSHVFSIEAPATPSPAALRRFPRALKLFDLQCQDIEDSGVLVDKSPETLEKGSGSDSEGLEKDLCRPVLKLLTRCGDSGDFLG